MSKKINTSKSNSFSLSSSLSDKLVHEILIKRSLSLKEKVLKIRLKIEGFPFRLIFVYCSNSHYLLETM